MVASFITKDCSPFGISPTETTVHARGRGGSVSSLPPGLRGLRRQGGHVGEGALEPGGGVVVGHGRGKGGPAAHGAFGGPERPGPRDRRQLGGVRRGELDAQGLAEQPAYIWPLT